MADFEQAVALVLKHEGGYVNDPTDPGGETNFGISKRSFPALDIRSITRDQAARIYRNEYWSEINGYQISDQSYANSLLDFAVNCGTVAARFAATKAQNVDDLTLYRIRYYASLKNFSRYAASWIGRTLDF